MFVPCCNFQRLTDGDSIGIDGIDYRRGCMQVETILYVLYQQLSALIIDSILMDLTWMSAREGTNLFTLAIIPTPPVLSHN